MLTRRVMAVGLVLAAAGCRDRRSLDLGLRGARPVAYATIRDASGVLGYAESLLPPDIPTKSDLPTGPGASLVDETIVAGAWELPLQTVLGDVVASLRARGTLYRVQDNRQGQLWLAEYQPVKGPPVWLLWIDGSSRLFQTRAVLEVRPGPHLYLIAYWVP